MQPIIPLWLIYLAGVCDDIKLFFQVVGIGGVVVICLVAVCYAEEEGGLVPHFKKVFATGLIFAFISVLIPSQKTIYTVMIGSQVTPQNIQLVGGTLKSTVDYMFDKTDQLIKDVNNSKNSK